MGERSPRRGIAASLGAAAVLTGTVLGSPVGALADPPANKIFGYEAESSNSRILEYDVNRDTSTVTFRRSCVPNPGTANGRGLALNERGGPDQPAPGGMKSQTRVLYNTFLAGPTRFSPGDGLIHRNLLPSRGCAQLAAIPFGEGPGGPNQDDIGALDFDDTDDNSRGKGQDADILYAAGYHPVAPAGNGPGTSAMLYKVNAENGQILGRCQAPSRSPLTGGGNDTISYARLQLSGRTERVLLTDFGEFRGDLVVDSLAAVDVSSLAGPPAPAAAPPCRILAEFPIYASNGGPGTGTGVDFEKIPKPGSGVQDSLVVTKVQPPGAFFDADGPPFSPARLMGPSAPSDEVEDISVNRVNPPEDR